MIQSKLLKILRQFSSKELQQLHSFMNSPIFNKHVKRKELVEYLLNFAPDFDHKGLEKKRVFQKVYEKEDYNDLVLNNLISDTLQLVHEFMTFSKFREDKVCQQHFLFRSLLDHDLNDEAKRVSHKYIKTVEQSSWRHHQFYYQSYQLENDLDSWFLQKSERTYDPSLQKASNQLDLFYLCTKLKMACDMAGRNAVISADYHCNLLEEVLAIYHRYPGLSESAPTLQLYYLALQLLTQSESRDNFIEFTQLLQVHQHRFPSQEAWVLYNYALNYCIRQINSGKNQYYQEIHRLYESMLEKKVILKQGYLTQWDYKNIVTVGIRIEDFAWTKNFIDQYQKYLLPEERDNAVAYNLAAYYYAVKSYDQALQQLQDVEFTDVSYHLGAKIIQLKSYYELDEIEPFLSLASAYAQYIRRNRKISDFQKRANNHFLKLARAIFKFKMERRQLSIGKVESRKQILSQQFEQLEPLANRGWLEEVFGREM